MLKHSLQHNSLHFSSDLKTIFYGTPKILRALGTLSAVANGRSARMSVLRQCHALSHDIMGQAVFTAFI